GSIGGTVKYFTQTPSLDGETHGTAEVGGANVDHGNTGWHAMLAGNLPIPSDTFGVRLAGYYEDGPGWIDNSQWGKDSNGATSWMFRARARARPADYLTVDLTVQLSDRKFDAPETSQPNFTSTNYTDASNEDRINFYDLNAAWDLGNATL